MLVNYIVLKRDCTFINQAKWIMEPAMRALSFRIHTSKSQNRNEGAL